MPVLLHCSCTQSPASCRAAVPPGCVSLLRGGRFQQLAVGGADGPSEGGSSQPRVAPPPAAHRSERRPLQFAHRTAPTAGGDGGGAAAGSTHQTEWRYIHHDGGSAPIIYISSTCRITWRQLCSYLASVLLATSASGHSSARCKPTAPSPLL